MLQEVIECGISKSILAYESSNPNPVIIIIMDSLENHRKCVKELGNRLNLYKKELDMFDEKKSLKDLINENYKNSIFSVLNCEDRYGPQELYGEIKTLKSNSVVCVYANPDEAWGVYSKKFLKYYADCFLDPVY